ncbi:15c0ded6-35ac-47bc-9474-00b0940c234b [Sclerotinia trifoliorum]|uniref:15c0ded6-35ac-47bc-9474-00b0940c234b n=1 Tax=Sclerotinia trifoliorum TaxID=28548 RepID=A0A8H2VTW6_9HELO|nr:15c0ded6-35ac-47bc-9474-00b0940c234b [Sclerotinia trifoliorum]
MAEVLGDIASGISIVQLAGNLAYGIIELKNCWDQIEDAPDNIAFLMREIESHQVILRSILETQARVTYPNQATGGSFEHSIKLCQNACGELDDLVTDLAKDETLNYLLRIEKVEKENEKRLQILTSSYLMADQVSCFGNDEWSTNRPKYSFIAAIVKFHIHCKSLLQSLVGAFSSSYFLLTSTPAHL